SSSAETGGVSASGPATPRNVSVASAGRLATISPLLAPPVGCSGSMCREPRGVIGVVAIVSGSRAEVRGRGRGGAGSGGPSLGGGVWLGRPAKVADEADGEGPSGQMFGDGRDRREVRQPDSGRELVRQVAFGQLAPGLQNLRGRVGGPPQLPGVDVGDRE